MATYDWQTDMTAKFDTCNAHDSFLVSINAFFDNKYTQSI